MKRRCTFERSFKMNSKRGLTFLANPLNILVELRGVEPLAS